jgi:hypothetical protein
VDRNQTYQLRDSELHALTEVGRFRVVATSDLAEFAYNGDSSPSNTFARGSHRLSLDIHTWRQLWTRRVSTTLRHMLTEFSEFFMLVGLVC